MSSLFSPQKKRALVAAFFTATLVFNVSGAVRADGAGNAVYCYTTYCGAQSANIDICIKGYCWRDHYNDGLYQQCLDNAALRLTQPLPICLHMETVAN